MISGWVQPFFYYYPQHAFIIFTAKWFIKELVLMCNAMGNPPFWIVTHGAAISVLLLLLP